MVSQVVSLKQCKAIVLDVAGTTTDNNFIENELFKYVTENCERFLSDHWEDEEIKKAVKLLPVSEDSLKDVSKLIQNVKNLTDQRSKNIGLKIIQAAVSKNGYDSGSLKAHVYDDVPNALKSWSETKRIAIYSTGTVDAQKNLFAHTIAGDLTPHISAYFDPHLVGAKDQAKSYQKISETLDIAVGEIVFITDSFKEAQAAKKAGMQSLVIDRHENELLSVVDFKVVSSLNIPLVESVTKRKTSDDDTMENVNGEAPPAKVLKSDTNENDAMEVDQGVQKTVISTSDNLPESTKEQSELGVAEKTFTESKSGKIGIEILPELESVAKKDMLVKPNSKVDDNVDKVIAKGDVEDQLKLVVEIEVLPQKVEENGFANKGENEAVIIQEKVEGNPSKTDILQNGSLATKDNVNDDKGANNEIRCNDVNGVKDMNLPTEVNNLSDKMEGVKSLDGNSEGKNMKSAVEVPEGKIKKVVDGEPGKKFDEVNNASNENSTKA